MQHLKPTHPLQGGKYRIERVLGQGGIGRAIVILLMVMFPVFVMAQASGGQIRRETSKQSITKKRKPNPKKENKQKSEDSIERIPVEADFYNVTFDCDVPSADLYIDGYNKGKASGIKYLKTGPHTIMLKAWGYESLEQSIHVGSNSNSFSFIMKKKENQQPSVFKNLAQLPSVIQNLVNNMVYIEEGTFLMGSYEENNEKPIHQVNVSSFYIGKCEVTQEEWLTVMGNTPSRFKGAKRPVENVSWNDCQEFIRRLNTMTGGHFRLPTEAEWEYAARGGNATKWAGSNNLNDVGWYWGNSNKTTHDVGQLNPNGFGLYDMSGNVSEYCSDWYGSYVADAQSDPTGPLSGAKRLCRGGSWSLDGRYCRVSYRSYISPEYAYNTSGLRLVLSE